MAKAKDLIIGTLALTGGLSIGKSAIEYGLTRTINNINYTLGRAKVGLAKIGQGIIGITLPVFILNGNEFDIEIDKFLGDVAYGTVPLAGILIPDKFVLVSGESIALDLFFEVSIPNTVQGVFNAGQNGSSSILNPIYLKGELFVLGGSLFGQVQIPIETTIPLV